MRILLVTTLIISLTLDGTCSNDDLTSDWVTCVVQHPENSEICKNDNSTAPESKAKLNSENNTVILTPTRRPTPVYCTTRTGETGICVLYYQCNSTTKTVIEDGSDLLDLRSNECSNYLEICCKIGNIEEETTSKPNDKDTGPQISPNRNKDQSSFVGDAPKERKQQACGWRNPGANPIVNRDLDGGVNDPYALFGDFPWMVALLKKSGKSNVWSNTDYLGGGTLIHPSVVMTAVHKLEPGKKKYEANELKCRAGEWDTQTENELYKHQDQNVMKFIKHSNYYRTSLYNDIALLILEKPFQLKNAPHIGIACLSPSVPPPDRECYSMGWGKDKATNEANTSRLKKVLLHPVEANNCQQMLKKTRLGPFFELHESLTCANGDNGVDTCRGDGGSPLVCAVSNNPGEMRFAVHGMVAYGIACFDAQVPGVYVNTAHLKSWVDDMMRQEGFDPTSYTM